MTACDWKYAQYPTIVLLFMFTVERYCLVAGIDNVILFVSFIVVHYAYIFRGVQQNSV